MTETTTFSNKSNAKRAAEKAIRDGKAPSIKYGFRTLNNGRLEIMWGVLGTAAEETRPAETGAVKSAEAPADPNWFPGTEGTHFAGKEVEVEATAAVEQVENPRAESPAEPRTDTSAEPFPTGIRVRVTLGKKPKFGTIDRRVDQNHWRVNLEPHNVSALVSGEALSVADAAAPKPKKSEKKERTARTAPSGNPAAAKGRELDEAAARGVMPEKPIVTSKANPGYQKRFDHLADLAAKRDWTAVRKYEVKGVNSYAKMVERYRDRLLAYHAATEAKRAA